MLRPLRIPRFLRILPAVLLCLAVPAWAQVTVSPAVSDGDYTVSWVPHGLAERYILRETGRKTGNHYVGAANASKSFKNRPAGTYSYRVDYCYRTDRNGLPQIQGETCLPTGQQSGTALVNSRPAVGALPDRTILRGRTRKMAVQVSDADGGQTHALGVKASNSQVVSVSVSGKALHVSALRRGSAVVSVTATDSSGAGNAKSAPSRFRVTVPNSRPSLGAFAHRSIARGGSASAAVAVSDADAEDAHWIAASSDAPGVASASASGKLLTVVGHGEGVARISVTATDDSGESNAQSGTRSFRVTVLPSNSRPSIGWLADRTVQRGATASIAVPVSDADASDMHALSAQSGNAKVASVSVSSQTLRVKALHRGIATISVTATDDSGESNAASAPATFRVTVPNSRPRIAAIGGKSVALGATLEVDVSASDADGDDDGALVLSASSDKPAVASVALSGTTLTVTGASAGAATVTVTATDASGAANGTGSRSFAVEVEAANAVPVVAPIADRLVRNGRRSAFQIAVGDADGDDVEISAQSLDAKVATVSVHGDVLMLAGHHRGRATIRVVASDGEAESEPVEFEARVPNSRPRIAGIGKKSVAAGGTLEVEVAATDADSDDAEALALSASSNKPAVATVSLDGTTLTVSGVSAGSAAVTVTAKDASGTPSDTASRGFAVVVKSGNAAPVVAPIADRSVANGAQIAFKPAVSDADGDGIAIAAESLNGKVARATVGGGGRTLTLRGLHRGKAAIRVSASDGSAESEPVEFEVRVPNSRPRIEAIGGKSVARGATLEVEVSASDADGDDDGALVLAAASDEPEVAEVSLSGTTLSVTGESAGDAVVTVTATDASGAANASASRSFAVEVPAGNAAPVVAPITNRILRNGKPHWVRPKVSDADGDETTLRVESLAPRLAEASVDPGGRDIRLVGRHRGIATIRVVASDGESDSEPVEFRARVRNSRPALEQPADQAVRRGSAREVELEASDADADDAESLAFSAESSDPGIAGVDVSGATLILRGVAEGVAMVTATVADASGADDDSASRSFAVEVGPPNRPPEIAALPDIALTAGQSRAVEVSASDADGDPLSVSASSDDACGAAVEVSGSVLAVSAAGYPGATVTATVSDGYDAVSTAFAVRVANSRPVVAPLPAAFVQMGGETEVEIAVADADVCDVHVPEAESSDPGIVSVSVSGGALVLAAVSPGTAVVEVSVRDGNGEANSRSVPRQFAVKANRPPSIGAIADRQLGIGYEGAAQVSVSDPDDAVSPIALSAVSSDPGVAEASASGRTVTFRGVSRGRATIAVAADDGSGGRAEAEFEVEVVGRGTLSVRGIPSATGAYRVSWKQAGLPNHLLFTLYETADRGATWRAVQRSRATAYHAVGMESGEYGYALAACDSGASPNSGGADWVSAPPKGCLLLGYSELARVDLPAEEPLSEDAAAGGLAYGTGVTKGGDSYANIPLLAVPGVNGLQPSLSADYSSGRERQQSDGELPGESLGYGWRLGGLSSIRHCVVHEPGDGGVRLDGTDALCLDGERLMSVGDIRPMRPGSEYRTLRESFARIETMSDPGRSWSEVWFRVELPDGSVREYGRTPDSQLRTVRRTAERFGGEDGGGDGGGTEVVTSSRESQVFQWSLSRETDAFGNEIVYEYHRDDGGGVRHPKRIAYGDGGDAQVCFRYARRTAAERTIGGGYALSQRLRLHRVEMHRGSGDACAAAGGGTKVREYRFASAPSGGRMLLSAVQMCGYRDGGGGGGECLAPLEFEWEEPPAGTPMQSARVSRLTDPLGRETRFRYATLTASGSHGFLFDGARSPFGAGKEPAGARPLPSPGGRIKSVATRVSRRDGAGGWRHIDYAYQGRGWESRRNHGFLGFHATRETDGATGIATYRQYRLDHPHEGRIAAVERYSGEYGAVGSAPLSKTYIAHSERELVYGGRLDQRTTLPHPSAATELLYEGGELIGAVQSATELTLSGKLPSKSMRTVRAARSAAAFGGGGVWGEAPQFSLSGVVRRAVTEVDFDSDTSGGRWLIGFAERVRESHYGSGTVAERVRETEFARESGTNVPRRRTRFPDDPSLRLVTSRDFDGAGNVVRITTTGGGIETRTEHFGGYAAGAGRHPTAWTDAEGLKGSAEYDAGFGLATEIVDAGGVAAEFDYDGLGRETERRRDGVSGRMEYLACAGGSCPAVTAPASGCGAALSVVPAMKTVSETDGGPSQTRYYDMLGRVVRTETESFGGGGARRVDVFRDARGLARCASAPHHAGESASYFRYEHDQLGRPTRIVRPDGGEVSVAYAARPGGGVESTATETVRAGGKVVATRVRREARDILGQLVETVEDAEGAAVRTTFRHDASGLLAEARPNADGIGAAVKFRYDAAGNPVAMYDPHRGAIASGAHAGWSVGREFSALGEVLAERDAAGETVYAYDRLGRPKRRTDPDGMRATWSYDAAGLLSRRTYGPVAGIAAFEETYSYDAAGLPLEIGRTVRADGLSETFSRSFAYDAWNRLSSAEHPSGLKLDYAYNARGYLSSISERGGGTRIAYGAVDAYGSPERTDYGNGAVSTRSYDALGRLTEAASTAGTATLQDDAYVWRTDGLLSSRSRGATGALGAREERLSHDGLGRLTRAETHLGGSASPSRTLTYSHDALGNVESRAGASLSYESGGPDGRRWPTAATVDGTSWSIAHDAAGRIASYESGTGVGRYVDWNGQGLPSRVTVGASRDAASPMSREEYAYGPDGERIFRKSSWLEEGGAGRVRRTFFGGGGHSRVLPGDGAVRSAERTLVAGEAMHVRSTGIGGSASSTWEYLHADHLGSPSSITDADGREVLALSHEPFGGRRRADWTGALPASAAAEIADGQDARTTRGYGGHEQLDRTGFAHMGGRLYDPALGRFLSPDPVVARPWGSQGWNPYAHAGNAPLSRVDPDGLTFCDPNVCGPGAPAPGGGGFTTRTLDQTLMHVGIGIVSRPVIVPHPVAGIDHGGIPSGSDTHPGFLPLDFGVVWVRSLSVTVRMESRTVVLAAEPAPADEPMEGHAWPSGPRPYEPGLDEGWEGILTDPTILIGGGIAAGTRAAASKLPLLLKKTGGWLRGTLSRGFVTVARDRLLGAGRTLDRNGLTRAGRSLQKHGDRDGSVYPKAAGTAAARNTQGQRVLREILESRNPHVYVKRKRNFIEVYDLSTGRGASFYFDGRMRGFLQPKKWMVK